MAETRTAARRAASRQDASGAMARAVAAWVVRDVVAQGRSLSDALEQRRVGMGGERDRALAQELAYGVLRRLPRLEALANRLLRRPLKESDGDVQALLLVGLYQLSDLRVAEHAAVSATVEAARVLGKGWAANLLNALLRRFQREREVLLQTLVAAEPVRFDFPPWLLGCLREAWPQDWQSIVEACNQRPPFTLRVNSARITRAEYIARLAASGMLAEPQAYAPDALRLERAVPIGQLPGFAEGLVSVQDAGAQLAAYLLGTEPGMRVLDACAAPGGKTAHILERLGGRVDLTAIDVDERRLGRIRENLGRLGLSARVVQGDATAANGPWAVPGYDRILLDAPCSATGVIRRHPDIKWLRRPADIEQLAAIQARMLDALWPLLAPGGVLLYTTCSLLPEENERPVQAFLERRPEVRERRIRADWGRACAVGRQTLPQPDGMDGFYFARLESCAS